MVGEEPMKHYVRQRKKQTINRCHPSSGSSSTSSPLEDTGAGGSEGRRVLRSTHGRRQPTPRGDMRIEDKIRPVESSSGDDDSVDDETYRVEPRPHGKGPAPCSDDEEDEV